MNLRIENKLTKNILAKYRDNGESFSGLKLSVPERRLYNNRMKRAKHLVKIREEKTKGLELPLEATKEVIEFMAEEETWEERINRIDGYKFVNPTPIRVHKSPTVWERLKDKIGCWLRG